MLAAVFGVERFHTYVYEQSFTIKSDHKLLESISRKNLADTPAQLQCMMLCLQGYDFTTHYHPGKEMVIPDTLSRFSPWPGPDLPLDITIPSCPHNARLQRSFPTSLCQWSRSESSCQPHHYWLAQGHQGGPSAPPSYWQHRETLTVEDGLVLQGEALIIPPAERERTLHHFQPGNNKVTVAHVWKVSSGPASTRPSKR